MDYYSPQSEYSNLSHENNNLMNLNSDFLKSLFNFLLSNFFWILLSAVLIAAIFFSVFQYAMPKQYVSTVKIYASVDNIEDDIASVNTEFTYTKSVVETYTNILSSMDYFYKVSEFLENKVSASEIKSTVNFAPISNTNLFKVTVKSGSSDTSYSIADAISQTAFETIKNIDDKAVLKTVESPSKASGPSSPNVMMYTALGFILGALIGIAIRLLYATLNIKVRSANDLLVKYDIPILAEIPDFK